MSDVLVNVETINEGKPPLLYPEGLPEVHMPEVHMPEVYMHICAHVP